MAQFALKKRKIRPVQNYLAALFLFPGKASEQDDPLTEISLHCGVSELTVERSFMWLRNRNWMGEDCFNGWYFFRGLDWVHENEDWQFKRAAILQQKDLRKIKGFFIGTVMASLVKTGVGAGTDRSCRRSKQPRYPISISAIEQILNISRSTAKRYRKIAENCGYIKMEQNLIQTTNLEPRDIPQLKLNNIEIIDVDLFGTTSSLKVSPDRLRTYKGKVFLQRPNYVYSKIVFKKR